MFDQIDSCNETRLDLESGLALLLHGGRQQSDLDDGIAGEQKTYAEQVRQALLSHFGDDVVQASSCRHMEELATMHRSLILVSRRSPENSVAVELRQFPAVVQSMGSWNFRRSQSSLRMLYHRRLADRVVIQSQTCITCMDEPAPKKIISLGLTLESALGATKPRRLVVTLCYEQVSGTHWAWQAADRPFVVAGP